ncbi:mandelate racemase/muconate lactonizing enzyme family protein [Clostridium sp. OM02-18AC]|uniref:mandelate racemase/muconate lactonizing enzyme family protein n=1 Tax=Clostridium sp. OM02-18AC TaxID=2292311 RepID=UPI000E4819F8|nr:mandelate racemase/muconate lactonizing enzyme family protein [Clostridium sp. OM02-18AC]RHV66198.1 mandelate racemase/muconate lactonizing enzyme family protein [Clostridium sp. OM02-18AC]
MKIVNVKVIKSNRAVYCKILTDEGITGLGESGAWGFLDASAQAIETFSQYLIGKDPMDIEHLWQSMYRYSHFRGAAIMGALSAIDIALWDIKGKYYNAPIWQLLGGKCRDKVRVYAHVNGCTVEEQVEHCLKAKEEGYTAVGHINPFLDEPSDVPFSDGTAAMLYKAEERVGKIREAVGKDMDICLELHRRLEPALAISLSGKLEQFNPMFLEDPIRPDNFDAMAQVASASRIPIATGERIHNIFEFQMLLERRACHYVRASICLCGGITGAMKIAAVAESHHCSLVPHNPLSPVATNAELQLCAAIDNLAIAEYPSPDVRSTQDQFMGKKNGLRMRDMVNHVPNVKDGYVEIPTEPGLGIELVPDVEKLFPFQSHKIATRMRIDGSVCDQ